MIALGLTQVAPEVTGVIDPLVQAMMVLLPAGYLMIAMLYGMAFAGDAEPRFSRVRTTLLRLLFLLHLTLFAIHGAEVGGFPDMHNTWMAVSAVAWAVVALFVVVTWRRPQPTVGALVLLNVGVLQAVASMFGPMAPIQGEASDATTAVHVVTAAFASASVVLSGIYGFLYLALLRQMRRRTFGTLFHRLPDLTQLARMTRRAALAGFVMLALGVNAGIGLAHAAGTAGFSYTDPTVLLFLGVWIHFGVIAFSRQIRGVSAQRASWAAVAGLTVLLGTLFLALVPGATFHALR
ncbi:MAG: cytochrome c biogenesis protein CcsA [Planctomycetota bacterium]